MSLRQQLQQRSAVVAGLLCDGGLLKAIRAELTDELSRSDSTPYEPQVGLSVAGFTVEWDDPRAQDVVLRRGRPGEEEVAVSGVLAPLRFRGEEAFPRSAAVKVCVKRSDDPVLRFDCRLSPGEGCDLTVKRATWYPGVAGWREVKYNGPKFRDLHFKFREFVSSSGAHFNLERIVKWSKPPVGSVKLNVDAACRPPSSAFAVVVRDSQGNFLEAFSGRFTCSSVPIAECTAIRMALTLLLSRVFSWAIIESDSLEVVSLLFSGSRTWP